MASRYVMTSDKLNLREVIALGVGGIIGGGIFSVLGVAVRISGNAAFLSYLLAGIIAFISGYSYIQLTKRFEKEGGSFTFLEHYLNNIKVAGLIGWVLIVGYIGTMAMYAFAFGSFATSLMGIEASSLIRRIFSVGIIGFFMFVNYLGVKKTGRSEEIMVYGKVAILMGFVLVGLYGILTKPEFHFFSGGILPQQSLAPVIAVGVIFVSFEGFQLLTYEYTKMKDGINTLKKGILISIGISTLLYILISLITTQLVTGEEIIEHKETILAFAASKIFQNTLFNNTAFVLIAIAALFSTASAINATLFGTARLGYKIAKEKGLPSLFSFRNKQGIPTHSILIVGGLTAVFTFLGDLEGITTFASVSFILIFGVVNTLCFKEKKGLWIEIMSIIGIIGIVGALIFLLWHLFTTRLEMLLFIIIIFGIIILMEFLYFERDIVTENIST